jgi:hypothetical protein
LICKNFDEYLENNEKYVIDDGVRELLLLSDLSDEQKVNICAGITPIGVSDSEKLPSLIADLLAKNEVEITEINHEVLTLSITKANNRETSIKLLVKCIPNWTEPVTMEVLSKLPVPYNQIADYRRAPVRLRWNQFNLELAKLLKSQKFISSVDETSKSIKVYTFRSSEHS